MCTLEGILRSNNIGLAEWNDKNTHQKRNRTHNWKKTEKIGGYGVRIHILLGSIPWWGRVNNRFSIPPSQLFGVDLLETRIENTVHKGEKKLGSAVLWLLAFLVRCIGTRKSSYLA